MWQHKQVQLYGTHVGCWVAADRGSMAPEDAPPGLRDREVAP